MDKEVTQDKALKTAETEETRRRRYRQYRGPLRHVVRYLAAGMALFFLLYISGILPSMGVYFIFFQLNGVLMAGMLVLIYLLIPARKGMSMDKLPWYDILFIAATLTVSMYITINALPLAYFSMLTASNLQIALAIVGLTVLLEAVRRTIGWPMIIIVLIFLLHSRWSFLLPDFALSIREQSWDKILATSFLSYSGMFGSLVSLASTIIYAFIAFGIFFMNVGGGDVFLKLALGLTGTLRGGPAKAAIVGSAMFGTLSSSPPANVAVTGTVTIPLMIKTGYSPSFAGAVESVASTGGQIMPPVMGSVAFIMAAFLGVSYASIAIAAVIPAVLYYLAIFLQTDLRAAKDNLKGLPRSELPKISTTLKEGWEFVIPFLALLFLLFVLRYPPPLSGTYALGILIVTSAFRKRYRLTLKRTIDSLEQTTRSMLIIVAPIAASGVITGLVGMTGLGPKFASGLVTISGGNVLFLLILAGIASYVIGMGGAMTITYILLAVLVAPALAIVGVPLFAAHFFIMYMGKAMFFTPPYCPAVFVASSIANSPPFPMGFRAMRLGIVSFIVPFIFAFNPVLLLKGEPLEIALAAVTAAIGVFALSVGIERYLFTKANWVQTILALGAGIAMILPDLTSDLIGVGMLAVVILWQFSLRGSKPVRTPTR